MELSRCADHYVASHASHRTVALACTLLGFTAGERETAVVLEADADALHQIADADRALAGDVGAHVATWFPGRGLTAADVVALMAPSCPDGRLTAVAKAVHGVGVEVLAHGRRGDLEDLRRVEVPRRATATVAQSGALIYADHVRAEWLLTSLNLTPPPVFDEADALSGDDCTGPPASACGEMELTLVALAEAHLEAVRQEARRRTEDAEELLAMACKLSQTRGTPEWPARVAELSGLLE